MLVIARWAIGITVAEPIARNTLLKVSATFELIVETIAILLVASILTVVDAIAHIRRIQALSFVGRLTLVLVTKVIAVEVTVALKRRIDALTIRASKFYSSCTHRMRTLEFVRTVVAVADFVALVTTWNTFS